MVKFVKGWYVKLRIDVLKLERLGLLEFQLILEFENFNISKKILTLEFEKILNFLNSRINLNFEKFITIKTPKFNFEILMVYNFFSKALQEGFFSNFRTKRKFTHYIFFFFLSHSLLEDPSSKLSVIKLT